MSKPNTLLLSREDVASLVDVPRVNQAVLRAFKALGNGRAQMPAKIYLDVKRFHGDFRAMPAYLEGMGGCSLKWVNAHPGNAKYGLPAVMAVIILNDPRTGFPLCIMDGTLITNLRTGAAGAVAAKYLARKDARIVGLVGCGAQAESQLRALSHYFKIKEVKVWGHKKELAGAFVRKTRTLGLTLKPVGQIRHCVEDCDIVVTATPSRKPLVKRPWISPGAHINAIGADAPGKQELDPAILKNARVFVDDLTQAAHSGEINVPLKKKLISKRMIKGELGKVVAGKQKGRIAKKDITVFDSTGLAVQDAAVAYFVYNEACSRRIGQNIAFVS